ncbi:MAG: hypothetical protein ABW218_00775 [Casimicrobiaceae bacterium]
MERGKALTHSRALAAGARFSKQASVLGRMVATLAVVVALVLWFAAESAYPAGAWVDRQGEASLAIALAVAILTAACVSSPVALLFSVVAGVAFAGMHWKATPASLTLAAVALVTVGLALWELRAAILARLPPRLLAGAIAAMPIGLWLSIHVGASVYAASLGAMLTTLVLYAFMRRAPRELDDVEMGARAGVPANPPDVVAAVKSLLLAVAGVGLLARVM